MESSLWSCFHAQLRVVALLHRMTARGSGPAAVAREVGCSHMQVNGTDHCVSPSYAGSSDGRSADLLSGSRESRRVAAVFALASRDARRYLILIYRNPPSECHDVVIGDISQGQGDLRFIPPRREGPLHEVTKRRREYLLAIKSSAGIIRGVHYQTDSFH